MLGFLSLLTFTWCFRLEDMFCSDSFTLQKLSEIDTFISLRMVNHIKRDLPEYGFYYMKRSFMHMFKLTGSELKMP